MIFDKVNKKKNGFAVSTPQRVSDGKTIADMIV